MKNMFASVNNKDKKLSIAYLKNPIVIVVLSILFLCILCTTLMCTMPFKRLGKYAGEPPLTQADVDKMYDQVANMHNRGDYSIPEFLKPVGDDTIEIHKGGGYDIYFGMNYSPELMMNTNLRFITHAVTNKNLTDKMNVKIYVSDFYIGETKVEVKEIKPSFFLTYGLKEGYQSRMFSYLSLRRSINVIDYAADGAGIRKTSGLIMIYAELPPNYKLINSTEEDTPVSVER